MVVSTVTRGAWLRGDGDVLLQEIPRGSTGGLVIEAGREVFV